MFICYNIFNICSLAQYVFFLSYSINLMCINFYFKLILIKKIIKHNQVNDSYCDIKYLDLHLSLSFFNYFFV